jgi:hypothetical protein
VKDSDFGNLIVSYKGLGIGIRTWIFILIPTIIAIIFSLTYGTLIAWESYLNNGPASAMFLARPWFLAAGLLIILLLLYFLYRLAGSLRKIEIFERGMIYRNFPMRHRFYYWSDITGITSSATKITFLNMQIRSEPSGKIYPKTGRPIQLTKRFNNIPQLVEKVKSKLYPQLWPLMKSNFLSGRVINLGRISLSNKLIFFSKIQIPWESIYRIKVESGDVLIDLRDKSRYRIPVSDVQNLDLFIRLVDWGIRV